MKISCPEEKTVKATPYPKGFEKQFQNLLVGMTKAAAKQFNNETIKKLNKGTVEKFQDNQVGNWANIFMGLSNSATKKIKKRFNKKRVNKEVKRIFESLLKVNQAKFYGDVEKAVGIPMEQMIAQEALTYDMNALIIETQQWVHKNLDDNLAYFTNNSLRVMSEGAGYDQLEEAFGAEVKNRINHAKFIGRNQISNFNAMSNKLRAQNLGITQAIWRTAQDERVRPSHEDRDGKTYDLSEGLYSSVDGKTLQTGTDYNCRCIFEIIIPDP